jgi:Spy/CpxP family protein refolding chaperone
MRTISQLLAGGVLLAATMAAQRPFGAGSSTPSDPATIVTHRVDRLTKLLSLSSSQASQATTIFTNALNAATPIETNLRTDRQSLQTAVKANDTATIDSVSANIGSLTGQLLDIQNKANAAFYAILNPSQQATLDQNKGLGLGRHGAGH